MQLTQEKYDMKLIEILELCVSVPKKVLLGEVNGDDVKKTEINESEFCNYYDNRVAYIDAIIEQTSPHYAIPCLNICIMKG